MYAEHERTFKRTEKAQYKAYLRETQGKEQVRPEVTRKEVRKARESRPPYVKLHKCMLRRTCY